MYALYYTCMYIHVQDKLGDVVYAELPEVGLELEVEGMLMIATMYNRDGHSYKSVS